MHLRKTSVEIDEELYAAVRIALGTRTLRETVESAFASVLRQQARREEVRAMAELRGLDLADEDVMRGAWVG